MENEELKPKRERRNKKTKERGNGEGTLYYSETLQCYIGQYIDSMGKRKTLRQKKNEKNTDFKKRFNETKFANDNGTYIEKSNTSISTILEKHIEYKHNNNITSDRTYLRDKGTLEQVKKCCGTVCNMPIQKIAVSHIKEVTPNITPYAQNSIDKIWRFINKAFKIAMSDRIITYNPMENIDVTKPKSDKITEPVEALTTDEQQKLIKILNNTNHKYHNILLLQLQTGMRIGEVLALSKDCINLKDGTLTIYRTLTRNKNDKVIMGKKAKTQAGIRTIFITPQTEELCKKILNSKITNIEGLLFYDYKNNIYISPTEVNSYLKRLNAKHSISKNLHTHMLRHTYATRFIEAGGSAKVLQKILGHKNIETTLNTYTSVFDKFSKDENQKYIEYMQTLGL